MSPKEKQEKITPISFKEMEENKLAFEGLFKGFVEDWGKSLKKDVESLKAINYKIIIGVIGVAILFVAGLMLDSLFFKANYNQHYLDTQKEFSKQINELRKENYEMRIEIFKENNENINK